MLPKVNINTIFGGDSIDLLSRLEKPSEKFIEILEKEELKQDMMQIQVLLI